MNQEVQMDGLIGPTHFFGGLAVGNVASELSVGRVSQPKAAALQGLKKMKLIHDLGHVQLVMPPHPRPALGLLAAIGFQGNAVEKIETVVRDTPDLLPVIYSSSAMWAANAATVSPSVDSANGKVNITPANLISNAHRALESEVTATFLKRIFRGEVFMHHAPLPYNPMLSDEGAANHMRLFNQSGTVVNLFVYGGGGTSLPKKYIPRQQLQASISVARRHQLTSDYTLFLQQHPDAIDAGVFHNDVIATSNDNLLIYHEQAFVDASPLVNVLAHAGGFQVISVNSQQLSLTEAVKCYLFNSQLITQSDGTMLLIAPLECEQSPQARALIDAWIAAPHNPIAAVQYIDVGQSMGNGGGPACLRLRMCLTEHELAQVHQGVRLTDALYAKLAAWIEQHYPERLTMEDLKDSSLPSRIQKALLKLENILDLKDLYADYF